MATALFTLPSPPLLAFVPVVPSPYVVPESEAVRLAREHIPLLQQALATPRRRINLLDYFYSMGTALTDLLDRGHSAKEIFEYVTGPVDSVIRVCYSQFCRVLNKYRRMIGFRPPGMSRTMWVWRSFVASQGLNPDAVLRGEMEITQAEPAAPATAPRPRDPAAPQSSAPAVVPPMASRQHSAQSVPSEGAGRVEPAVANKVVIPPPRLPDLDAPESDSGTARVLRRLMTIDSTQTGGSSPEELVEASSRERERAVWEAGQKMQ